MTPEFDFLIIGGGIAGASTAAGLAEHSRVCLIEMEDQPGYHSTGRSAALFAEAYGNRTIRALTGASRRTFYETPPSFAASRLVRPRDVMVIAHEGQEEVFDHFAAAAERLNPIKFISPVQAREMVPILRVDTLRAAGISRGTADIDVHQLHHGYLRLFKARNGVFAISERVLALEHDERGWTVRTPRSNLRARVVVNAAGAWAGKIAALAGAADIGLRALKRTACLVSPPPDLSVAGWPMLLNVEEEFYLKPEAGMLLLSPADEGETQPCDAQADELDIAIAVDRVEHATTLNVQRITHRWAGLRSFVADSSPVVGYDLIVPDFFWVAALGGYGIQTAPAIGQVAACLARRNKLDDELIDFGIEPEALAPGRIYREPIGDHLIGVAKF